MPGVRILIMQNSPGDAAEIAHTLRSGGFTSEIAVDVDIAMRQAETGGCDLVLIDDAVGEHHGTKLCGQLRSRGLHIPILFVTANSALECRIAAFRSGGDDFVTRPYDPDELILRLEAVLRRCHSGSHAPKECRVGGTVVDLTSGEAIREQRRLRLTAKETHLFSYLWNRREQVVSKDELLREVWRYFTGNTRTVEVHVATLRRKLEGEPHRPRHLVTLRGRGYVLFSE